jgi:hypothetical protein
LPLWENKVIYPDTWLISDAQIQFRQYFPFGKAPLLTPTLNLFPILKKKKNASFVKTEGRKKKKETLKSYVLNTLLLNQFAY